MLGYTGRRPQKLVLGLEQRLASDYPSGGLQSEKFLDWDFSGKLWEDFCTWKSTWQGRRHAGNLFFSHSSSRIPRAR